MELLTAGGAAVSLGNLVWPLFVQFSIECPTSRSRIFFWGLLSVVVAASPFRGVLFSVIVFAGIVPAALYFARQVAIHGWTSPQVRPIAIVIVVTASLMFVGLAYQTYSRKSDMSLRGGALVQIAQKLGQRVAIPLYQGVLAQHYALDPRVPSLPREILSKLHLASPANINKFLYAETHHGVDYGETTSLFYGEAALRTNSPPIVWSFCAILSLFLLWAGLRVLGYDVGALVGIAIWRASLSGLTSIVPSLAIQVILYICIYWLVNRCASSPPFGKARVAETEMLARSQE
jgi:hypothetical protein